jgi:hypothetical protein
MDLKVFEPQELHAVLRALRNVAVANDSFTDAERDLITTLARLHDMDIEPSSLEPITYEELARVVVDPHRRKRAVQLAIVTALVEGEPPAETEASVRELANALGIDEGGVDVLFEVSRGRALIARFDMVRRARRSMRRMKGFPGMFRFLMPLLGLGGSNPEAAARYRALEHCAPGTLGRAVFDHFDDNGFAFPGELKGFPEFGIFHDIGHVISGYSTDPQGEIQQAAFQAGFVRRDGFVFLLFGILQFHLAMRITPVAQGYQGLFDVELVLRALQRGAACKVDFTQGYDLFGNKDRPLEEIRRELGVPPLEAVALAS